MRKKIMVKVLFLLFLLAPVNMLGQSTYKLVWSDEFNKPGKPDSTVWSFEDGFVRNEELQWYQPDNAFCEKGLLIIEGRKEKVRNTEYNKEGKSWKQARKYAFYTSSSLKTAGKKEFLYGRIEVRAKIPVGGGAWPAIWTLGNNMEWPSCGEIDIMEYYRIQGIPHILANAAWGTDARYHAMWNSKKIPFDYFLQKDKEWASKFHIWRMDWDEEAIKLYLDNELLHEIPLSQTTNGSLGNHQNPFKQPHYILLNLALGGVNGGEPDEKAFPMRCEIDYVRVYQKEKMIRSGELWPDNEGNHINAHGGGVLHFGNKYYWFGEHKSATTSSALVGVTCYSSTDLCNWTNEGVALSVSDDPASDIVKGCIIERPKVIYNNKTKKFVMWFHLELKDKGYAAARAAVAVSDQATGPYQFIGSFRANPGVYPFDMPQELKNKQLKLEDYKEWWTPKWYEAVNNGLFIQRDLAGGQMSRDMTLFVDEDGKAYHIYSSEENLTLHIAEMNDAYLGYTGKYMRVAPAGHNEAPAIFKKDGMYWMITSGCTGWAPNEARMFSAPSIWGPWTKHPNPCTGENAKITYGGQSTYILTLQGEPNKYIFMADIWRPKNPIDARYIWLPVQFDDKGVPFLKWIDEWSPAEWIK